MDAAQSPTSEVRPSRTRVIVILAAAAGSVLALAGAWRMSTATTDDVQRYLPPDGSSVVYRTDFGANSAGDVSVNYAADNALNVYAHYSLDRLLSDGWALSATLHVAGDDELQTGLATAKILHEQSVLHDSGPQIITMSKTYVVHGDTAYLLEETYPRSRFIYAPARPMLRASGATSATEVTTGTVIYVSSAFPLGTGAPYTSELTVTPLPTFETRIGQFEDCLDAKTTLNIADQLFGATVNTYCSGKGILFRSGTLMTIGELVVTSTVSMVVTANGIVPTNGISRPVLPLSSVRDNHAAPIRAGWAYTAPSVSNAELVGEPVAAFGNLYVTIDMGDLRALDAATGAELWRFRLGGAIFGGAAVAQNRVMVGASDKKIYAVGAETGTLIWAHAMRDGVTAAPVVSGSVVYVADESGLLESLDILDGRLLSSFDAGSPIEHSPVVTGGVVYVASAEGLLYALDAQSLDQLWTYSAPFPPSSAPLVTDDAIYLSSHDSTVYAVRKRSQDGQGALLWSTELPEAVDGPLAVHEGLIVGASGVHVFALSASDGVRQWTSGESSLESAVAILGKCVVVASDKEVLAYSLRDGTLAHRWHHPLFVERPEATPRVVSVGADHLYVGTELGKVIAFDLGPWACDRGRGK